MASKTGIKWASEMVSQQPTTCHCVSVSTAFDVVEPRARRGVALMHRVDPQVAGLAARVGLAPLADAHPTAAGLGVMDVVLTIGRGPPQVVDVGRPRSRLTVGRRPCCKRCIPATGCDAPPGPRALRGRRRPLPARRCRRPCSGSGKRRRRGWLTRTAPLWRYCRIRRVICGRLRPLSWAR